MIGPKAFNECNYHVMSGFPSLIESIGENMISNNKNTECVNLCGIKIRNFGLNYFGELGKNIINSVTI